MPTQLKGSAFTAGGAAVAVALAVAALSGRLPTTDNSVDTLLGADAPAAEGYRVFRRAFGADDLTLIELSGGSVDTLVTHLKRFHRVLRRQDDLRLVVTASTAFGSVLDAIADDGLGEAESLPGVQSALDGPLNRQLGLLRLEPPRARLLAASMPGRPPSGLAEELRDARAAAEADDLQVRIAGTAVLNRAIDLAGRRVESVALPAVVAITALALLVALRSLVAVVALLATVGLVIFGVDSLYGALGGTSNVLVVIHRPVSLVLILASGVHLVDAWHVDPELGPFAAAKRKRAPIILALFTTATGFASLAVSPLPPIRAFGALTAICLVTAIPVVLGFLPLTLTWPRRSRGRTRPPGARAGAVALAAARFGVRSRSVVIAVAVSVLAAGLVGGLQLPADTHAIHYFEEDSEVRRDHEALESSGLGLQSLEVLLQFDQPWEPEPSRVRALDAFGSAVVSLAGVTTRFDPALLLLEAGYRVAGRAVPPDPLTVDRVWSADASWRRATIARDGHLVRCAFLIQTLDASRLDQLERAVIALAREHLSLDPAQINVTGNYRLLLDAQRSLLETLLLSLLATAVVMQVVLALVLRSLRLAALAMIPNLFPVATTFVAMAALGIPLDLGTCMVATLSLGIAVDDTLHFLAAWDRADLEDAARRAGRPILLTSVIMAIGFAVLIPSDFRPTSSFGLLSSIALLAALVGDLIVLPALLSLTPQGAKSGGRVAAEA